MAKKIVNSRIQSKRDTKLNWEVNDPVLLDGEIIIVDDEKEGTKLKIGDGKNKYSDLSFFLDNILTQLENKIKSEVTIPSGMIMIWSGSQLEIPDGWVLCDGNNGTPDLTDKFVIGAGSSYPIGETGGTKTHNHLYKVSYRPYYGALVGNDNDAIQAYDYESGNWVNSTQISAGESTRSNNGILQGQWSETTPLTEQAEGKSSITSNMPPYYSLCYIMKI